MKTTLPNVNLSEQLSLAARILSAPVTDEKDLAAARLAELVLSLHDWLAQGGLYPQEWAEGHLPDPK